MKIDMHSHFLPRDCFDLTDREGHNYGPSIAKDNTGQEVLMVMGMSQGPVVEQLCDPKRRIKDMDDIGLDMQVISIQPPSVIYNVNGDEGLVFHQRYNNAIAEVVRAYPDRFLGMATVPMQDIPRAVPELERAVHQLGLKAVEIISNVNGRNLDEPEFWPFYQKAQELDIPIYVHPDRVAAVERLQRYWLINLVGYPSDTTIAIASIAFGGVLERFPRLKFLFSHAGGTAPFLLGRWDHGYRFKTECHSTPKPPSDYVRRMYFDTIAHSDAALAYLINTIGADRVVLGSDYPFAMGDQNPVATVRNAVGVSPASKKRILEQTSSDLLKLAL